MEFGKAVERLRKEKEEKLRIALSGLPRGGAQVAITREIELEYAEKMCSRLADIWVNLLEGTNAGVLTRQHVDFIKEQVQAAAASRRNSLMNGPPMVPNQQAVAGHIAREMQTVEARVCRDLELRLLRQNEGLPKGNGEAILVANAGANNLDDAIYARMAIDEARKSVPENDGKPHPWVGAVVVKDGKVLSSAHRGEVSGNHAEFTALERNIPDASAAGATVYVTLEPCTTRNRPKIPCADRLIERRIKRVVVGMLDPDDRIRGKGHRKLTNAGIEFSFFPHDLAMEVEELNREFTRFCEQNARTEVGPLNMDLWKEVAGLRTEFAEFKQSVEAKEKERAEIENFPANFVLTQGVPNNYIGTLRNDSQYHVCVETIQILRGDVAYESPLTEAVKPRQTDDWKVESGTSKTLYFGPQYEPIGMYKSLVQSSDPNFPNGKVVTIALALIFNADGKRFRKKYTQQVLMQGTQILPWGP